MSTSALVQFSKWIQMSKLIINEHKSSSYAPRTYHNASVADVTVIFAIDHTTGGEKCTHKAVNAAKSWMLMLDPNRKAIENARAIYHFLKHHNARTVNIAGNGMATWHKHGWTQEEINWHLLFALKLVHTHWPIEKIVSGGQTGTDIAAAVAAVKLGIDCELTYPKGYKMRWADGVDVDMTEESIMRWVDYWVGELN